MDNHDPFECQIIGIRTALLCAVLGVLVAYLWLSPLGIQTLLNLLTWNAGGLAGIVVLFWAAAGLGKLAGSFLCERRNDLAMHILVGIGVAFGSIVVAVLAGSVILLLFDSSHRVSIIDCLFFLLMMLLFGGIPAACLGALYGFLVRKQIAKLALKH